MKTAASRSPLEKHRLELVERVMDGVPVDWRREQARSRSVDEKRFLASLRLIAAIAAERLYRRHHS